jgi:pimeloyl-ACP methyl ester carboxylesterase
MDRLRQIVGRCLLVTAVAAAPGCLTCCHPIVPPPPALLETCHELPKGCRAHVYIFLMRGLDPLDCANLTGLCNYVHTLGFLQTYSGYAYHRGCFQNEIERIRQEDPDARIVLIGHDIGAGVVCSLAHELRDKGVGVDLIVYLAGHGMECEAAEVGGGPRVVNVVAGSALWPTPAVAGAEDCREDAGAYAAPTHKLTLELLAHELNALALTVPVVQPAQPAALPEIEEAPTPRPVRAPVVSGSRDEWDFLKPVSRLRTSGGQPDVAVPPAARPAGEEPGKQNVVLRP